MRRCASWGDVAAAAAAFFVLVGAARPVWAEPAVVVEPPEVAVGQAFTARLEGAEPGSSVKWRVNANARIVRADSMRREATFQATGAGDAVVTAIVGGKEFAGTASVGSGETAGMSREGSEARPMLVSGARQLKPGDPWQLQVEGVPAGARVGWSWDEDLLARVSGGDPQPRISLRVKTRSYLEKRTAWVTARVVDLGWSERAEATIWEYSKGKPMQGGPEDDGGKPPVDIPPAEGPLKNLRPEQRAMAELIRRSIDANNPLAPQDFYSRLQAVCDQFGLEKPMVELNRVKTELIKLGVVEQYLGPRTDAGGSEAEAKLLGYRRDLTLEGIRYAVAEVLRQNGGNADAIGHVFLAKIGKWSKQSATAFTIAGDIDFTFLASDPATAMALVKAFNEFVKGRIRMNMAQLDSVATAHGQAEHLVYVGPQGEKYGDDAMVELGRKPADIKNSGVELIDFLHPESAGSGEAAVSGREALQMVLFESVIRDMPPNATLGDIDAEFERRWAEKRSKVVEPFLSMEMARHLEGDIIRQVDVFAAFDVVKKGSKYLRRSNDIFQNDFKTGPADAAWTAFVRDVDDMAAGKWPEGMEKPAGAGDKPTPADIMRVAMKFFESQGDLGKLFQLEEKSNGSVELKADAEGMKKFLAVAQQKIWDNVSKGFDFRIRLLNDLHSEHNEARRKALVEQAGRQLDELMKMLSAGLEAMQHENTKIPDAIQEKARILLKLLEALPSTAKFKIPPEEIERLRKLLAACDGNGNAQRLTLLGLMDKIDKWVVEKAEEYSPKTPNLDAAAARTAMFIDGVNSVLDFVDNSTIQSLRDTGVIDFEYVATGKDGKAEDRKINIITCEGIAKLNARLNESVLGRIGNSTAFKAFNLEQEAEAYYNAVMSARTPGEAFGNLSTEFFRRRVPGGDAIEAAVMGDWTLASLKVVYVLFPTAAIPEALWGLSRTVQGFAVSSWWSSALEAQVDGFYAAAEFRQEDPATGKPTEKWFLHAITDKGTRFARKELLTGNCALFADEFDTTLWANLAATDPFITLMEELENHEAAGQKVRDKFRRDLEDRWQKVRASFVAKMIERLEARRASSVAGATGEADKIYSELVTIATELEVDEQVHKGMEEEWDSDNLKKLWVAVKNAKRWVWGEGLAETERNKAITVVTKYRDGYRVIRDARAQVEAAVAGWFSGAELAPGDAVQHGLRLLTGVAFLTGVLEEDSDTARRWAGIPGAIRGAVEAELTVIKRKAVPSATLDAAVDKQYLAKIAFEDIWIRALDEVGSRNMLWGARLGPMEEARRKARAKLIDEYAALYGGVARALVINVRQKLTIKGAEGERPRVEILPLPAAEVQVARESGPVKVERENESDFVAREVSPGKHSIRVSAKDFKTETGDEAFVREIEIPGDDEKASIPAVSVVLVPVGEAGATLPVTIDVRDPDGKDISERPVPISEEGFVTLVARATEQADSGKLLYNWAMGDKVLGDDTSKSIRFRGQGLAGQTSAVTVVVIDSKAREGGDRVDIAVAVTRALSVRIGEYPRTIGTDGTVQFMVEAPAEGAGALTYEWFICENGRWRDGVRHDRRSWAVAPGPLVGEGGTIRAKVIVRDDKGHSGEAVTEDITVGAPQKLQVELSPANSSINEKGSVTLRARVERQAGGGELKYYWDGAAQPSRRDSLRISGADMKAAGQVGVQVVTTVRVVDQKGREGEASATVVCEKGAPDKPETPGTDKSAGTQADGGGMAGGAGQAGGTPGLPPGVVAVALEPSTNLVKVGQSVYVAAKWPEKVFLGNCRVVWSQGDGNAYSCTIPAKEGGKLQVKVEYFEQKPGGGERLAGAGSCEVVVIGKPVVKVPGEVMYSDIFDLSVTPDPNIAPMVSQYYWYWGTVLSETLPDRRYATATPSAKMQYAPHDRMTQMGPDGKPTIQSNSVMVTVADAAGKAIDEVSVPILVRPVRFSVTAGSNWKVGQNDKGIYFEREKVVRKRKDGDKDVDSATASGNLRAVWETFVPETEAKLKENVEGAAIWQSLPPAGASEGKIEVVPFSLGDFKGYIKRTTTVVTRYNGNSWGYVDVCLPQANTAGWAQVMKGQACLTISYSTGGGGTGLGVGKLWWDDMPFLMQHAKAADAEIRAMLGSLKLTPDENVTVVPYSGPGADGSDAPGAMQVAVKATPAEAKSGQLVDVAAEVTGGKAPYEYTWTGDHAGKGAKVTFVSQKAGEHKLSVAVKDADGATASGEVTIKVAGVAGQISGLPGDVVYGQKVMIRGSVEGVAGAQEVIDKTNAQNAKNQAEWEEMIRKGKEAEEKGGIFILPPDEEGPDIQTLEFKFIWHSDKEGIAFDPPEGMSTTVLFGRMGETKIWAQVIGKDGATLGETPQSTVAVVAPKFRVVFDPPAGQVGQEIRARVFTDPMKLFAPIFYRWSAPESANRMEHDEAASDIGFKVKEPKALRIAATAEVPHYRDSIADIEATFTPGAYAVKVTVEEAETTKPKVWDPVKGGIVTLPKGSYAGDEQIRLRAEIEGEPKPQDVRWKWTVNEGTSISNDISQTPTVSRHETGTIAAAVEARDKDGVLLGGGSINLSVTVAAGRVNPIVVTAKADRTAIKSGERTWLRAEVKGGTPPYTYQWTGGAAGSGQSVEFRGEKAGDAAATVNVKDSKGKTGSAQVTVKVEPVEIVVSVTASKARISVGETVELTASAKGGTEPYAFTWMAPAKGQAAKAQFAPDAAGDAEVTAEAQDKFGNKGTGKVKVAVAALEVTIEGLRDEEIVGASRALQLKASPPAQVQAVFSADPALAFEPATAPQGKSNVRFDKAGSYRVRAEAQVKRENAWVTVGRSKEYAVTVAAPKLEVVFDPAEAFVGQGVKALLKAEPPLAAGAFDVEWKGLPGSVAAKGAQAGFKVGSTRPIEVTAVAKAAPGGAVIGEAKGTFTAKPLEVKIEVLPGPRPQVWDAGKGEMVELPPGKYAAGAEIGLKASLADGFQGATFAWTAKGGGISGPATGATAKVMAQEKGTCEVAVVAKDRDGSEVGKGAIKLDIAASQEEVTQGEQQAAAKKAADLVAQAKKLADEGKFDDAIAIATQAAKIDPKNAEAPGLIEKIRAEAAAQKLVEEGYAAEKAGRLAEAIGKYEEAVKLSPDPRLETRIAELKKRLESESGGTMGGEHGTPGVPATPGGAVRQPTEADLAYVKGFTGVWNSNWGRLRFRVEGVRVIGDYDHDEGRIEAELTADGRTLVGTWHEAPSRKPPRDAGKVTMTLSADGKTIAGRWGYGDNLEAGDWTGTRVVEDGTPGAPGAAGGTTGVSGPGAESPPGTGMQSPLPPVKPTPKPIQNTGNTGGVQNGPTAPTTFTVNEPFRVTYVMTYHWNYGRGARPGAIAMRHSDGTVAGPWQASGSDGQGGVKNAYWVCEPNVVIKPGTYTIVDSDPSTWAQNPQSGGRGHVEIKGYPVREETGGEPVPGAGDVAGTGQVRPSDVDGTYAGRFEGGAGGDIRFTISGGRAQGTISGSYQGSRIVGEFRGIVDGAGNMSTALTGQFVNESQAYPFAGKIVGVLKGGAGVGSWDAENKWGKPKGGWRATRGDGASMSSTSKGGVGASAGEVSAGASASAGVAVQARAENSGSQNVHIFVEGQDSFGPQNRVAPGGSRTFEIRVPTAGRVTFVAGRNGSILARRTWDGDPEHPGRYPVVRFSEPNALSITTGLR